MAKSPPQLDVLVLGDHPAAYFAAMLLKKHSVRVAHSLIPGEKFLDRLVQVHPAFFELDASLAPLQKQLDLSPVYGLQFLADDPATHAEYSAEKPVAYVGCFSEVHDAVKRLAEGSGVSLHRPQTIGFSSVDETGVKVQLDKTTLHPKLIILAGELAHEHCATLGLPDGWEAGVLRRYTWLQLKGSKWGAKPAGKPAPKPPGKSTDGKSADKPLMPMSLDVGGKLTWGWLLCGGDTIQPAVEQPLSEVESRPPEKLLRHWIDVLGRHGHLKSEGGKIDAGSIESVDLPLAGALAQEGVASRTLLIGPAGGFYTASGEDIYPNCWSAVFAVDVARKALKEKHLQDALQPFRQEWGATLGDYLRGPQQNLRFLLPLIYRNKVMTARLAEAILTGKSVVR